MKEELMGLQRRISTNQTDKISEKWKNMIFLFLYIC
jgi:hypothetical protein